MTHDTANRPGAAAEDRELDDALEDTFPASDPPALTNPSSFTGAEDVRSEKEQDASSEALDAELDEALEETFPASDPPALTNPSSFTGAEVSPAAEQKRADDKELDEELKQTFPASDPPSVVRKSHSDDT